MMFRQKWQQGKALICSSHASLQHQINLLAAELCPEGMQDALKQGTDIPQAGHRHPSSRAQTSLKHVLFSDSEQQRPWLDADVLVDSQGGVHSNLDS